MSICVGLVCVGLVTAAVFADLGAIAKVAPPRPLRRRDTRIAPAFLGAGPGYGSSSFPKDADSLVHTATDLGYDFALLRAPVDVNRERAQHLVAKPSFCRAFGEENPICQTN